MKFFPVLMILLLLTYFSFGGDDGSGGKWSYDQTGPANWGQLDEKYAPCGSGLAQSPIDLQRAKTESLPVLEFQYQDVPLKIANNGANMDVVFPPGSFLVIGKDRFQLLQFHFHRPSEHAINGQRAPMEVHLVHQNSAGRIAVVGILMQLGGANSLIDTLWNQIPSHSGQTISSPLKISARDLLPADRAYFRYDGSLTTPPCSEGLLWHVLRGTIGVSQEQVDLYSEIFGDTARPLQPLNGRTLGISQ